MHDSANGAVAPDDRERALVLSMFEDVEDNQPRPRSTTWPKLVQSLTRHLRLVDKAGAQLWSPARYAPKALRAKTSVIEVCVFAFDVDDGTTPEQLAYWLRGMDCIITSSFSHTDEHPKLRAVVRLVEPIPAPEYDSAWRRANQHLLHGHVDPSTKDASRMFYLPSCPPVSQPVELVLEGEALDWRSLPDLPVPKPLPKRKVAERNDATNDEKRADALLAKWERDVAAAPEGYRHWELLQKARAAGGLVASGLLEADSASAALYAASVTNGEVATYGERSVRGTITDGLEHGRAEPWTPDDLPDSATWTASRRYTTTRNGVVDADTGEVIDVAPGSASVNGTSSAAGVLERHSYQSVVLNDVQALPIDWLWKLWLVCGMFSLLEGDPGLGKSLLITDLAARLTTGRPMPGDPQDQTRDPLDVILLANEDDLARTIRPRFEAAGADMRRVHVLKGIYDDQNNLRPPTIGHLSQLREMFGDTRARALMLDPLFGHLPPKLSPSREEEIRPVLTPLIQLVEEFSVCMLGLRHLAKAGDRPSLYRGLGAITWVAQARTQLRVIPDPTDDSGTRLVVGRNKGNLGREPWPLPFEIVAPFGEDSVPIIRWASVAIHQRWEDVETLALQRLKQQNSVVGDARRLLLEVLGEAGQSGTTRAEIDAEANDQGISSRSIERARIDLGSRVVIRRVDTPDQPGHKHTRWWLDLHAPLNP